MKTFGAVLLCLALGACAAFIAMLTFTTPENRGGGSWDITPMFGLVIGLPTWFLSFPAIYLVCRQNSLAGSSAFFVASAGAFILTITVPFALHRFGFY